jgi:hypothetical protein
MVPVEQEVCPPLRVQEEDAARAGVGSASIAPAATAMTTVFLNLRKLVFIAVLS